MHDTYYVVPNLVITVTILAVALISLSVISLRLQRRGIWLALPWVLTVVCAVGMYFWTKASVADLPEAQMYGAAVGRWDAALTYIQSGAGFAVLISLVVLAVFGTPRARSAENA